MATITKRNVKRNKNKADNKATSKGSATGGTATPAKDIAWNASRPTVKAAIEFGVAHSTTAATTALVEQIKLFWKACGQGEASPAHAGEFMHAINTRVHARKVANNPGATIAAPEAPSKSRKSELRTIMRLHGFNCRSALATTLASIDTLSFDNLYRIAVYMHAEWKATIDAAPSRNVLMGVIGKVNASKAKAERARKRKAAKKGGKAKMVVGMPHDPERAVAHGVKYHASLKALIGKACNASEAKQLAGILDALTTLKAVAVRINAAAKSK